jgi:hypothetical protein
MIAFSNYRDYVKELWNIKRVFGLDAKIRNVEESFWSFGICYVHKVVDIVNNRRTPQENNPLYFSDRPNPPRGGPFAKNCPNDC